jgi:class 3 adenylate cyclase
MGILAVAAKTAWKAVTTLLVLEVGWHVLLLVPIPPYGLSGAEFRASISTQALAWSGLSVLVLTILGVAGARVESKTSQDRLLRANDPATLLAEIVSTEWQLALQSRLVSVMVVDVAKSSRMKANANPLEVEYSFREYQSYVRRICAMFEGNVHSTAGDGAVIAFSNCQIAYEAARRIQEGLDEFNETRNRLAVPFRLRIGIHMGPVAGEINEIQFTEVIDIAAHVESAAEVGGIAVTQPVAEHLPGARLAQLPERVGGFAVYSSLPPGSGS